MQIECPFCHTRAALPESKEGSKVRCGSCGKVYTARPVGAGRRGRGSNMAAPRIAIAAVAVLALIALAVFIRRNKDAPILPTAPAAKDTRGAPDATAAAADTSGWASEPVLAVRAVYDAAAQGDAAQLLATFDPAALAAHLAASRPDDPRAAELAQLDAFARRARLEELLADLARPEDGDGLAAWRPHDGRVTESDGATALVRVQVARRDPAQGLEGRTYDWRLVRSGERWKAAGWEREVPEQEVRAETAARARQVETVTLSDGSKMHVAEPRALEHLEGTPAELRQSIERAFARMVDFSLRGPENGKAMRELVEIGKPAIPRLLTGLHEIRVTDDTSAAKVNLIDQALRGITGLSFGYEPGATTGESEERRDAAVRAWFAWWLRQGEAQFEERKETTDALEDLLGGDR